jgi:hypothetical protein
MTIPNDQCLNGQFKNVTDIFNASIPSQWSYDKQTMVHTFDSDMNLSVVAFGDGSFMLQYGQEDIAYLTCDQIAQHLLPPALIG